jgi:hypothetical protein
MIAAARQTATTNIPTEIKEIGPGSARLGRSLRAMTKTIVPSKSPANAYRRHADGVQIRNSPGLTRPLGSQPSVVVRNDNATPNAAPEASHENPAATLFKKDTFASSQSLARL